MQPCAPRPRPIVDRRSLRATARSPPCSIVAACDSSVAPPEPPTPRGLGRPVHCRPVASTRRPGSPRRSSPDASDQPRATSSPARSPSPSRTGSAYGRNPGSTTPRSSTSLCCPPGRSCRSWRAGRGQRLRVGPRRAGRRHPRRRRERRLGRDRRPRRHALDRAVRGPLRASTSPRPRSSSISEHRRRGRAASELNAFGISLYKRLLADPDADLKGKGVAMSPTSIAMALAMARAGANGSTAAQMDRVLRANGWNDLGIGLGSLQQILNGRNATWTDDEGTRHSLSLNVVNRAFAQHGWPIEQAYLQRIGRAFGAGFGLVDYMRDSSDARDLINGWVARQTANRIPKLLGAARRDGGDAPRARERHLLQGQLGSTSSARTDHNRPFTTKRRLRSCRPWSCWASRTFPWRLARAGRRPSSATRRRRLRPAGDDADPPRPPRGLRAGHVPALLDLVQAELRRETKRQAKITTRRRRRHALPAVRLQRAPVPAEVRDRHAGPARQVAGAMGMPDAFDPSVPTSPASPPRTGCTSRRSSTRPTSTSTRRAPRPPPRPPSRRHDGRLRTRGAAQDVDAADDKPFVYLIRDLRTGAILFMGRVLDPTKR